ncbi:branched-chain amino acid ABC transporter permease [Agrobacterium sp. NPDC090283]|uniref:ABC transporter permease subunit n=1 Tax=Agrobacterium sp. NPDC090283 TaxID=3363920 RepID=UPI00383B9980
MKRSVLRQPGLYLTAAIVLTLMFALPAVSNMFTVMQTTQYVVLAIFSLSLAYIWGFCGILSFGQAAFFGLGAYTFAVSSINFEETTFAFVLACIIPGIFGLIVGYFMFYGRLSDVTLGVVTMVISLIFWKVANHTAGPEYKIGKALLGGYNGIPSIPTLTIPGQPDTPLDPVQMFQFFMLLLLVVYVGLKLLVASPYGRLMIGIRENETRASLLGYDVRLNKVIGFSIGSAIAGMAGGMWATYQSFIDPNVFSLEMSAKALVWVLAGGVGTLVGPLMAAVGLQWLTLKLGTMELVNSIAILGAIMIVLVMVLPRGVVPSILGLAEGFKARCRSQTDAKPAPIAESKP